MAFIDNTLTVPPVPGEFIGAGSEPDASRTYDYEDGPIALQDNSVGLAYQQWRAYIYKFDNLWSVYLEADNLAPYELFQSEAPLTDISIAFNQNADLHYTWVERGVAYLRYFDTISNTMQTMELPEGIRTPKITLDDKREGQDGINDIILSYIGADGKLYFRMQRERFGIEYELAPGPYYGIDRLYMNEHFRLQWRMLTLKQEGIPCAPAPY